MDLFKRVYDIASAEVKSRLSRNETSSEGASYKHAASGDDDDKVYSSEMEREVAYYANLELNYGASFDQIKASYKRLMKRYHPDLHHGDPEKKRIADKIVSRLNEAYRYFSGKFR